MLITYYFVLIVQFLIILLIPSLVPSFLSVPLPYRPFFFAKKSKLVESFSFLPSPARDWAGARALPAGGGRVVAAALWESGKVCALFRFSMAFLRERFLNHNCTKHLRFVAALCGRVLAAVHTTNRRGQSLAIGQQRMFCVVIAHCKSLCCTNKPHHRAFVRGRGVRFPLPSGEGRRVVPTCHDK